jgi:hypothetical protein
VEDFHLSMILRRLEHCGSGKDWKRKVAAARQAMGCCSGGPEMTGPESSCCSRVVGEERVTCGDPSEHQQYSTRRHSFDFLFVRKGQQ